MKDEIDVNRVVEYSKLSALKYGMEETEANHIQALGAYGAKAKGFGASSFALNKTDVIDAGNLLEALGEESVHIKNIWLTHQHLDHIVDIAYIIDNYFGIREESLNILGTKGTIEAIRKHFLNDEIWPDFSKIKLPNNEMVVKYTEIELGKEYKISENETMKALKTDHTDSSCGYVYTRDNSAILITADTCNIDNIIKEIENNDAIKSVVIECSFPNELEQLALKSKHLTPNLLFDSLQKIKRKDFQLYINHIKPTFIWQITQEIEKKRGNFTLKLVNDGDFLKF